MSSSRRLPSAAYHEMKPCGGRYLMDMAAQPVVSKHPEDRMVQPRPFYRRAGAILMHRAEFSISGPFFGLTGGRPGLTSACRPVPSQKLNSDVLVMQPTEN
jgi:hypothetical protein